MRFGGQKAGLLGKGDIGLFTLENTCGAKYNIGMRILLAVLLLFTVSLPARAERISQGASSLSFLRRAEGIILRKLSSLRKVSPARLPPASQQARFLAPGKPLADVGRLAEHKTVLSSLALPLDADGFVLGSGFVIRSAAGRLYAVAAYHVSGSAGKPAGVRVFGPDGNTKDFTGLSVSAGGSYGINAPDVSLIELPASAEDWVRPLGVAHHPPREGHILSMWGRPYDAGGLEFASGLEVESAYGMKIVLNRTREVKHLEGMCGAPVLDENGLVAGIYGGRGAKNEALFAIDARKSLSWLIQNYESGLFTPYTFRVFGMPALELEPGESVGTISHKTADGQTLKTIDFPTYRGPLDVQTLENVFEDLRPGDVISFEVLRGRTFVRSVVFEVP